MSAKVQILRLGSGAGRRACDRCHGHKLRCPRDSEDAECLRCQRAKVSCTTGSQKRPSLRARARMPSLNRTVAAPQNAETAADGRKRGQLLGPLSPDLTGTPSSSTRTPGSSLHTNAHLGVSEPNGGVQPSHTCPDGPDSYFHVPDALELTFEEGTVQQPPALAFLSNGPWPSWWSAETSDPGPLADPLLSPRDSQQDSTTAGAAVPPQSPSSSPAETASWAQKLYELTVQLHQHLQSVPSVGVWHQIWEPSPLDKAEREALRRDKDICLSRTFELSQEFTELLNHMWPRFRGRAPAGLDESAQTALDPPLRLLVMTGYLSLVETYDKALLNIQACAQLHLHNDPATAQEKAPLCLPPMQIGSFEMTSSSSTQVAVLIHVMEAMMMRMCKLVKAMAQKPGGGVPDPAPTRPASEVDISLVTLQALEAREKSTMELLETVRKQVVECGIL